MAIVEFRENRSFDLQDSRNLNSCSCSGMHRIRMEPLNGGNSQTLLLLLSCICGAGLLRSVYVAVHMKCKQFLDIIHIYSTTQFSFPCEAAQVFRRHETEEHSTSQSSNRIIACIHTVCLLMSVCLYVARKFPFNCYLSRVGWGGGQGCSRNNCETHENCEMAFARAVAVQMKIEKTNETIGSSFACHQQMLL